MKRARGSHHSNQLKLPQIDRARASRQEKQQIDGFDGDYDGHPDHHAYSEEDGVSCF